MKRKFLWGTCIFTALVFLNTSMLLRTSVPTKANSNSEQTSTWWKGSYPVTQAYGCTSYIGEPLDPRCSGNTPRFHAGIDIGMPCGTPLYAPIPVTVISVGGSESGYYGPFYPRIRLPDGHDVILAHVEQTVVTPGQHLNPGTLISYSGTLGNSSGCHLHFEVRTTGGGYGTSIDPGPFLNLHSSNTSVGVGATPDGGGYWLVGGDGGVFTFGDAGFYGSLGGQQINASIVGMAVMSDGKGYWLVGTDGGIFTFGDANFYGSMGGQPINAPVVGMAATTDGQGYWLVGADGGVFAFGDANFYGSMGGQPINASMVGIAATSDGGGYWLVGADGGIFTFGDANFYGSRGGQ